MNSDKDSKNPEKHSETKEASSSTLNSDELEMFSKVEEKLKTELEPDVNESEQEDKDRTLYAYCSECQENIFIHYKESIIINSSSSPIYLVWIHGKPFHGLLVRIDKNFVSRGERVVHLEFDPELSNQYG